MKRIVKFIKLKPLFVNKAKGANQATGRESVSRRQTYQGKHPSLLLRAWNIILELQSE